MTERSDPAEPPGPVIPSRDDGRPVHTAAEPDTESDIPEMIAAAEDDRPPMTEAEVEAAELEEDLTRVSRASGLALIPAAMAVIDLLSGDATITSTVVWSVVAVAVWYAFRLLPAYVRRHGRAAGLARIRAWARILFWVLLACGVFAVWQWGPTVLANHEDTIRQGIGITFILGLLMLAHSGGPDR